LIGDDTQHLLRERQHAGGSQRFAVRDADHRDGFALLAFSCADNDAGCAGLHIVAGGEEAFENFIERHGWLP
jgi:hypothetical protein